MTVFDPEEVLRWMESEMRDWQCAGWGLECSARINPETEHLFGEASLCWECYSKACDQFIAALEKLDPCD